MINLKEIPSHRQIFFDTQNEIKYIHSLRLDYKNIYSVVTQEYIIEPISYHGSYTVRWWRT